MPAASIARRLACLAFVGVAPVGCASRPIIAPLAEADRRAGSRYENRAERADNDSSTLVVLAFSGGGMRAADVSYGVLEELRRTEVTPRSSDEHARLLRDLAAPDGGRPGTPR